MLCLVLGGDDYGLPSGPSRGRRATGVARLPAYRLCHAVASRRHKAVRNKKVRGRPTWDDRFSQYGIKVSFLGLWDPQNRDLRRKLPPEKRCFR